MVRVAAVLVSVLVAASPADAQPQTTTPALPAPVRDTPTAGRGTSTVRGRVVDAVTGRGLPRVEIRIGGANLGTEPRTTFTDATGRYELGGLPAGLVTVVAVKPNYVRSSWGEERPEGPGKRVTLTDAQRLDAIDFKLQRSGVIVGRIVDEVGEPVTDAGVHAMRYQFIQGARRLMPSGRVAQTNDLGEFRLYGLSPGQYYVSAILRSNTFGITETSDQTAYAPTFYPGTGNLADAHKLAVAPGQTISGINLTLLPIQTATVTGRVVDSDGRPSTTNMIMVSQRTGSAVLNMMPYPVTSEGTFTLHGLTPGDYVIRAQSGGNLVASMDVTVNGSDVNDLVLIASKPSTIRGRVVFTDSATSAPPPRPAALEMGAVREWAIGQPMRSAAKIAEDGTFEISLTSGHVVLRVAPVGGTPGPAGVPGWRLNRVMLNDVDVADTGIDIASNASIDNVVVEMTNRVSEVTGSVTDADGKPVRECYVIAFAQDSVHWTVQTRHLAVVRPAADDLFHLRLLPGDYYVVAFADVETNAWTDPDFLALAKDVATKVSVADSQKQIVNVTLSPAPVY
ncbi:MAG TPA: carboxypeptidase-like regulatory domain-containing protein [Vicinamibacterales bacterium]|jgi:hypothetical protein